jgi:hypothetical protein
MNLIKAFNNLPIPNSLSENAFSAVPIPSFINHRLGKDRLENPCLLIDISNSSSINTTKQKLYNLLIFHNLSCEIVANSNISKQNFSCIRYIGNDNEIKQTFLKTCEFLLPHLGNNPNQENINEIINKLIELFRSLKEPARKSIQGLWAELFLIANSSNIERSVKAWHICPEETYDFNFKEFRIEVKSTQKRNRVHHFSFQQLSPPQNTKLYIASVQLDILANGVSVLDLIDNICDGLADNFSLIEKVKLIAYSTLGSSVSHISEIRFDYDLAKESLSFFDYMDVPKISLIPKGVSEVRFCSDLENIDKIIVNL